MTALHEGAYAEPARCRRYEKDPGRSGLHFALGAFARRRWARPGLQRTDPPWLFL